MSPEDTRAQFLVPAGSVGRNRAEASLERAQNLNPMVDVKADPENVESKPEAFFTQFDAVRAPKMGGGGVVEENGTKGSVVGGYRAPGWVLGGRVGAWRPQRSAVQMVRLLCRLWDGPECKNWGGSPRFFLC